MKILLPATYVMNKNIIRISKNDSNGNFELENCFFRIDLIYYWYFIFRFHYTVLVFIQKETIIQIKQFKENNTQTQSKL